MANSGFRFVDIRDESEYLRDEVYVENLDELRQRHAVVLEFLSAEWQCAHCGRLYRGRDNFKSFGCAMHSSQIVYDKCTGEGTYWCCGATAGKGQLQIGCTPCIHSRRKEDFIDVVLAGDSFKNLSLEIVERLKPFPIGRQMIVGRTDDGKSYRFATSQAQLDKVRIEQSGLTYGESVIDEEDEMELLEQWNNRAVQQVGSDNWKIKLFIK
jgi:hypothetical protein